MSKLHVFTGLALAGVLAACAVATGQEPVASEQPDVVLGVFDSRAVAVAFAHSDIFQAELKDLRTRHEAAKAAGNEEEAAECAATGEAWQEEMHLQGFCGASVAKILDRVADQLPGVAADTGVDVIVSRWDLAYRTPDAKTVDITNRMVEIFGPDDRVWETVKQMRDVDLVSEEEVRGHEH